MKKKSKKEKMLYILNFWRVKSLFKVNILKEKIDK